MSASALTSFSSMEFRQVLGTFATGVTVIGMRQPDGRPLAMTVSSFNALSLTPPLVLWSLGMQSRKLAAFTACTHFSVNVLSADQADLALRFASGEVDWATLPHHFGPCDAPLLAGALAHLECANHQQHDLGDHRLFVGQVLHIAHHGGQPLLYHAGGFHTPALGG